MRNTKRTSSSVRIASTKVITKAGTTLKRAARRWNLATMRSRAISMLS
jgi:hypothetical protein